MYFRYSITIPPNTTRELPTRKVMKVGPGILHILEVSFPPGCAALAHVYICHWEQQLWPWNTDETFAWDDYTIRITNINFGITTPPYRFVMYGWNEDMVFPHTIVCRLGIKKPELHRPGSWVGRLLRGETQG